MMRASAPSLPTRAFWQADQDTAVSVAHTATTSYALTVGVTRSWA